MYSLVLYAALIEVGRMAPEGLDQFNQDGSQLAFVRTPGQLQKQAILPQTPEPWAIWIYDVAQDQGREIWHSGDGLDDSLPSLTADNSFFFAGKNRILFASEHDGWNHLYSVPTSGGSATLLTPGKFETEDVSLSTDKNSVLFSSNQDDIERRHLWRVGASGVVSVNRPVGPRLP